MSGVANARQGALPHRPTDVHVDQVVATVDLSGSELANLRAFYFGTDPPPPADMNSRYKIKAESEGSRYCVGFLEPTPPTRPIYVELKYWCINGKYVVFWRVSGRYSDADTGFSSQVRTPPPSANPHGSKFKSLARMKNEEEELCGVCSDIL
jgi:hypothetical protein